MCHHGVRPINAWVRTRFLQELLLRSGYSFRTLPQSVLYSTGICATLPLLTRREVVSVGGPPDGGICWRFDVTPRL